MVKKTDEGIGTMDAVKRIGISLDRLYYWERLGIVKPLFGQFGIRKYRRYSQEDIQWAIYARKLIDEDGYKPLVVAKRINEVRKQSFDGEKKLKKVMISK